MNRLAIYSIVRSHPVVPSLEIRLATFIWLSYDFLIKSGSGGRRMTSPLPQPLFNPLPFHALR